ncbi:MAG: segregation/condensation protein A [Clostridia bacterium]|nr:segregation/condensation protein A [Clostridia bacterium]
METSEKKQPPALKIDQFEGPLDLLFHLIEKNKIDIYDIPISEITDQYIDYLSDLDELDMDLASDFLLMASTLLHLKSRLLLPQKERSEYDEPDPREELILRLLEYRRCKTLAEALKKRHECYADLFIKPMEPPARLGLRLTMDPEPLQADLFWEACQRLSQRNSARFQDQRSGMIHILQREKVSLKEKMAQIWHCVVRKTQIFFNELFPADRTSRTERVTGFLALLELMRLNRVEAHQEKPFDVIRIKKNAATNENEWFPDPTSIPVEDKEYE